VLAAGVVAAACSSNGSSSSSTTTTTAATTTTTAARSTTTTTGAPATTTTAGTVACGSSQVSLTSSSNSGAGHIGLVLVFTNHSSAPCQITGYPGVAGLNAAGQQAAQAERTPNGYVGGIPTGSTPPVVVLQPGQSASAILEGSDVPTGTATSCPTYASLLVTPPNTTVSIPLAASMPGCSALQIHPVVAGTSGSIT